jgi:hypothetical protein
LAESKYWRESELSHFRRQSYDKESILLQKLRSAELMTMARLGRDKSHSLIPSFRKIDFVVSNFSSKTNSYELQMSLHQVLELKNIILNHYADLEKASQRSHVELLSTASYGIRKFGETEQVMSSETRVLNGDDDAEFNASFTGKNQELSQIMNAPVLAQQAAIYSSATATASSYSDHVQPQSAHAYNFTAPTHNLSVDVLTVKSNESAADLPFDTQESQLRARMTFATDSKHTMISYVQRPSTSTSKIVQVSLVRTNAGFGITFSQRGSDVFIGAVATGSPAHR